MQVALQYEFDAREIPEGFNTGYLPYGVNSADQYPVTIYGTEVFEVNEALRDKAFEFAQRAKLNDSSASSAYRVRYAAVSAYAAALESPMTLKCDTTTSDVYWSGTLLSEAFENTTKIWTNQSDITYCMTAQEDNATLEVLVRMATWNLVDFSRVIVMRTGESLPRTGPILSLSAAASNFDRPPPSVSAFEHLRLLEQNGFRSAVANVYLAGVEIIKGILDEWDCTFDKGIIPTNYIGDIFGSLGGKPDFGPGSITGGVRIQPGTSGGSSLSQ